VRRGGLARPDNFIAGVFMAKKILVVFYSRTGTTRKAANYIAGELGSDTEEILDVKSRWGLFGWLRSGMEGVREMTPPIQETKKDPSAYDVVVLGTPWWGGKMSSPLRSYIAKNKDKFRQVAFLITSGGEDLGNGIPNMEAACGKKHAAVFTATMDEVKGGSYTNKIRDFLSKLK